MNQFNIIHDDWPTESQRDWNIQTTEVNLKYLNYTSKTSPMVLTLMRRLNNHVVDNSDVKVYNSGYALKLTHNSITGPYNTPIKLIYDGEMNQLLKLFY